MSKYNQYTLPKNPGDQLTLGQLIGAASAIECSAIADCHPGLVMLITTDMQSNMQIRDEISSFTRYPVILFPDWETLPYDRFSPSHDIISDRISILYHLSTMQRGIIIISVNTLMQKVFPHSFLHDMTFLIKKGHKLSQNILRTKLINAGYLAVNTVIAPGEFAVRCTLLDLYPIGSKAPFRINFLNEAVTEIRLFDVNSQRTLQKKPFVLVLPAHEFPTNKMAIALFCSKWSKIFEVRHDDGHIYQQVSTGVFPAGIEYWLPLFFSESLVSILSYLPKSALIVKYRSPEDYANHFWKKICIRFEKQKDDLMRPLMGPEYLWLRSEQLFKELQKWPTVRLIEHYLPWKVDNFNTKYQPLPDLAITAQRDGSIDKLRHFCQDFNGSVIFLVESEGKITTINELLDNWTTQPKIISSLDEATENTNYLIIAASQKGCIDIQRSRVLITEGDLLDNIVIKHRHKELSSKINTDTLIHNLYELRTGQPVVHIIHGIGRYAGMTTIEVSGIKSEYLIINYAEYDKLYVPVTSLHLISRYQGHTDESPPLHKLGGVSWSRTKQKISKQVRDAAVELLDIYSQRAVKIGYTFQYNRERYKLFCKEFSFELTFDQDQAISAVLSDMCQSIPMDRLVCGDVGFGKTEVAMRAAFLATENNKQVAVLVPTTLLAQQHLKNFRDRFAKWPVYIEMISRFCNANDQKKVLKETAEGQVNILIGTHKILQKDINWHDLGLLIIDEEHRFGVRDKERIKAIRSNVDTLTMTATPIPRTMNMAMQGIRDLSVITTPPERRLAIKTNVCEYDSTVIREAILREIMRGGQVYYLYNNVEKINKTVSFLKKLVPEAEFAIGHGQMMNRDLERIMNDFYHQRFNVLVCTSIIETGIDIANANTIIIERADNFGLAQLYQLRGRVGRSYHQAYAYLLTPAPKAIINNDALKRLEVIASLEDLGSGFALATHDLEIRGAGNLLGKDQSGRISAIGFSLYMQLLENAIDTLKAGQELSLENLINQQIDIELYMPAILPDDYITDINIRLSFYKRIASAKSYQEIDELRTELIDRFGILPDSARYLLLISKLRQQARPLGIKRIESNDKIGFIKFHDKNCVDPVNIIKLLQRNKETYSIDKYMRLKFIHNQSDCIMRLDYIKQLLTDLAASIE